MDTTTAWIFVIVFWLAPIVHVATSPRSGPAHAPEGARCPFGPRVGWLVIVVLLGACASFVTYLINKARGSGLIEGG